MKDHQTYTYPRQFQIGNVLLITFSHLLNDTYAAFVAPLLPLLIAKFGLSYFLAGVLAAGIRIPALLNPFIGIFADKVPLRYFIILTPAITGVMLSLLGVAPSYPVLVFLTLVAGLSSTCYHVTAPVMMKHLAGDKQFYQLYFQEPGNAEAELEADVRKTIGTFLYSGSGDAPRENRLRFLFSKSETFLDTGCQPETLPAWLSEQDLSFYTKEFERTGFRGGLNWYRNIDRNWELTTFLSGAKLSQPTLFVAGEADGVIQMYGKALETMEENVPNLRDKVLIPGAGHWVQQERATEVNELLIEFMATIVL